MVVVVVAAAAVGLRGVLQAPLAQADLERLQGPVDARASRVIGAPAPSPTLTVSDEAFFLTYTLAAGSQAYSGLLTERDCRVVIRVDRRESSSAKLVYGVQRGRGCMVPAQARVREARRGR
ncbi:hypothetical protein GKE82_24615 [Conexibacter sp. W3-3-2]|uniref:hypothetical protein n=1 Tax=Conexibacter sp. W3-3-2 TaxID=2675227 RepID=UPI0012B6F4E3|nr:hypothetical protein [Conexibacter sp. W3-3-2]MTD47127.1 hypothetical protein [Conexibacter sp. W3-3-2]MTD47391.1 hypothetical protein [Conexibacter sp. W3-3-2]